MMRNSEKSESVSCLVMSDSATPWTVAHQASLSIEFFRQEYWSWLLFPSPGDLADPGTEPGLSHWRHILYHLNHREGRGKSEVSSETILVAIPYYD